MSKAQDLLDLITEGTDLRKDGRCSAPKAKKQKKCEFYSGIKGSKAELGHFKGLCEHVTESGMCARDD